MFNIIKKTSIASLFFGSILLPMDPPTQESAPISIITVLDKNIQYFSNEIAALSDKIIRANSREHLRQRLESEKSELQKLLELNQSVKQQLQDNLNEQLQGHRQKLDDLDRLIQEGARETERISKQTNDILTKGAKQQQIATHQFTRPEVTPFFIDTDQRIDNIITTQSAQLVKELNEINHQHDEQLLKQNTEAKKSKPKFKNNTTPPGRNILILLVPLAILSYLYFRR